MVSLGPLLLAFNLLSASAISSPVNLRTANDFAILTETGITTTGTTSVTGDIGTCPIAASAITGFGLVMDSTGEFSTSSPASLVTGNVYAEDYEVPTKAKMTTAIEDMATAYTNAAGRSDPDFDELGAGLIEGRTLTPGLYKWTSGVGFTSSLTFSGAADAVWILQIAGDLNVGAGASVTLSGGARPENIFWQVSGSTVLETTAHMEGIILCATSIVFKTGSSLNGAALAQTAVTLDGATIVKGAW